MHDPVIPLFMPLREALHASAAESAVPVLLREVTANA